MARWTVRVERLVHTLRVHQTLTPAYPGVMAAEERSTYRIVLKDVLRGVPSKKKIIKNIKNV